MGRLFWLVPSLFVSLFGHVLDAVIGRSAGMGRDDDDDGRKKSSAHASSHPMG